MYRNLNILPSLHYTMYIYVISMELNENAFYFICPWQNIIFAGFQTRTTNFKLYICTWSNIWPLNFNGKEKNSKVWNCKTECKM